MTKSKDRYDFIHSAAVVGVFSGDQGIEFHVDKKGRDLR
jgi:hypothetical protein